MDTREEPGVSSASDRTRMASQEAAYWFIRWIDERKKMSRKDRQTFLKWLKTSPENIAEILKILEVDGKFAGQRLIDRVGALDDSNVIELVRLHNVAQYDYQPSTAVSDRVPRKRFASVKAGRKGGMFSFTGLAAAVAVVVLTVTFVFFAVQHTREGVIQTVAAQWQHVTLPDGSTVSLDARTRLKVDFTSSRRVVRLNHGWAVFQVAKDPSRPFTVVTDAVDVTALGTRFGVSIDRGVITTVEEGVVEVTPRGKRDGSSVLLHAGEELHVRPVGALTLSQKDVARVDAKRRLQWVSGKVELVNTSIGEIVRQFNRRHEIQARIEDPKVAAHTVDLALLEVDNVDNFIEVMESRGVTVSRSGSTLILRARMD